MQIGCIHIGITENYIFSQRGKSSHDTGLAGSTLLIEDCDDSHARSLLARWDAVRIRPAHEVLEQHGSEGARGQDEAGHDHVLALDVPAL